MVTEGQTLTKRDFDTRLIEKAWKDPEFRRQVVSDPKGMLEKHIGKKLPAEMKIFVHEEDANTLHLSIPPTPSNASELSDEDLEKVAGGTEIAISVALELALPYVTLAVTAAASAVGTAAGSIAGVGAAQGKPAW